MFSATWKHETCKVCKRSLSIYVHRSSKHSIACTSFFSRRVPSSFSGRAAFYRTALRVLWLSWQRSNLLCFRFVFFSACMRQYGNARDAHVADFEAGRSTCWHVCADRYELNRPCRAPRAGNLSIWKRPSSSCSLKLRRIQETFDIQADT